MNTRFWTSTTDNSSYSVSDRTACENQFIDGTAKPDSLAELMRNGIVLVGNYFPIDPSKMDVVEDPHDDSNLLA